MDAEYEMKMEREERFRDELEELKVKLYFEKRETKLQEWLRRVDRRQREHDEFDKSYYSRTIKLTRRGISENDSEFRKLFDERDEFIRTHGDRWDACWLERKENEKKVERLKRKFKEEERKMFDEYYELEQMWKNEDRAPMCGEGFKARQKALLLVEQMLLTPGAVDRCKEYLNMKLQQPWHIEEDKAYKDEYISSLIDNVEMRKNPREWKRKQKERRRKS